MLCFLKNGTRVFFTKSTLGRGSYAEPFSDEKSFWKSIDINLMLFILFIKRKEAYKINDSEGAN